MSFLSGISLHSLAFHILYIVYNVFYIFDVLVCDTKMTCYAGGSQCIFVKQSRELKNNLKCNSKKEYIVEVSSTSPCNAYFAANEVEDSKIPRALECKFESQLPLVIASSVRVEDLGQGKLSSNMIS